MNTLKTIDHLVKKLKKERDAKQLEVAKLTAAINALNGAQPEKPAEVKQAAEPVSPQAKAWITRKQRYGLVSQRENLTARDFAEDYIRKAGREVSCRELFDAFRKAAHMRIPSGRRWSAYQKFYMALHGVLGKERFTSRTEGMGGTSRTTYFNVKSVAQLQDKPQPGVSQEEHPIVGISKY